MLTEAVRNTQPRAARTPKTREDQPELADYPDQNDDGWQGKGHFNDCGAALVAAKALDKLHVTRTPAHPER